MDFYEVLDQVIALLRSRGRVTYRALKRQFELDDDFLEDLKEEIIDAQRVAVEEDGRILVWTSEPEETRGLSSQTDQTSEQPPVPKDQPPQVSSPYSSLDAERRQLTVMFCDLVDSTKLSGQLDPEDLRDVIRAYQSTSADVIEHYDGYIAQHLGDGLMAYFGWPQAHEDDARRAVHAGLGIIEAMHGLNSRLEQEKGIRLSVRIGIHTGLVVVDEIGQGVNQEHLALGETPNVASRIEGIAAHDTVAISDATYQLVHGYFVYNDLGLHTMKGVDAPQHVYRVVKESDAQNRLDVAAAIGLTTLVGRQLESALLFDRWQQVKDGQGQVVLLSGEAGIGKSRLLQVLREHVSNEPHTRLECRSSPYYQNTALYPITDLLQRTLAWQPDDTSAIKLEKLEQMLQQYQLSLPETVPLFATLLSLPLSENQYAPLTLSPQQQRQKTLESIVAMLLEQAEQQPVLFILEDLHWTDPTTLELLDLIVDQAPTVALLTLLTCRPEFEPAWGLRSHLTPIALNRFTRAQVETMVDRVTESKALPSEVMQHLAEKTDGVPLYVEEMTKAIVESGVLQATNGHYALTAPLASLAIPTTLQDSLMARLDRLGTAKSVAQLGAVLGRTFTYELLHAVSSVDELVVWQSLVELVQAELLYQRGSLPEATFTFKHALVQETAYQSLLRSTRQQHHLRIAETLIERFPNVAETQPELLAHHYTEADRNEQAIGYWQQAGEQAAQRSAHAEAIAHLTRGLELVRVLSDTSDHKLQEIILLRTLGTSLLATKGFAAAEVETVYTRARELCYQIEDTSHIFPVLFGLWGFYNVKSALQTARELAEELLDLAQRHQDPAILMGHRALGDTLFWLGEYATARAHLEQGIALYDAGQHHTYAFLYGQDPLMGCRVYLARILWVLGYPNQALQLSKEAIAGAQQLAHSFSLAFAIVFTCSIHLQRREWQALLDRSETLLALCTEQGFAQFKANATSLQGRARVMQGDPEAMAQVHQGITAYKETGARRKPRSIARLAELYLVMGEAEAALDTITEGLATAEETGERCDIAELYRLKGMSLLALASGANDTEVEFCFHRALSIARQQQAKSWELRTATSLARLWQFQGKCQAAYDLLQPVYDWFSEGFDTADLQDAKTLLQALESESKPSGQAP